MFSLTTMSVPSTSSLFSTYASISASMMLVRSILNEVVPPPVRTYLYSVIKPFFTPKSSRLTLIIEEKIGFLLNEIFEATEVFLSTKINSKTSCLKISKVPKENKFTIQFERGEEIVDFFDGVELKWRFACTEKENPNPRNPNYPSSKSENRQFELCFDKKHREMVMECYLPSILKRFKEMKDGERVMTLSGLLNFIDGLWSGCGDERIIIFTTNHKEKLDPALLRPGRMDMHIHMSYCNLDSLKILAKNYLGIFQIPNSHKEIEELMENVNVTPAQVAEELMRSDDVGVALDGVVNLLKRKRMEEDGGNDGECSTDVQTKRPKSKRRCNARR
ncbi:AAA-type ATPase, N-terminal domain [Dillenia turbinata]|uniref:AAA-type ATPase, N-terminal domain n=1 Tax=Dillenia turbinata TaxID=194707 RepID=A0AAN8UXM2_9MAGN